MQKKIINLYRLILSDRNTRNLFFFLLLNLLFAFVELFYGLLTNSLGLISDSFHMFFDCSALLLGLAASLVTKWRPNEKFTYGFGRAEILAGLANGLFLLFIALFIMKEAIERTFEPPEVHHERLLIISVLGFLVNIVGIFVFQHGGQGNHHHHHVGGCSHNHSHIHSNKTSKKSNHDHNHDHGYNHYSSPTIYEERKTGAVALDMNGYSTDVQSTKSHQISHGFTSDNRQHFLHEHSHNNNEIFLHSHNDHNMLDEPLIGSNSPKSSGRGQIMQSVFLHIVADTLGSVGVMISALLMGQFGWLIADPICSLFIAILISLSVFPLLRDSFYVLMQRVPVEIEDQVPGCLQKIQNLNGVLSVYESHFWTLHSDTYIGSLKLEVSPGTDTRAIMATVKALLTNIGVDRVHVHIDQA